MTPLPCNVLLDRDGTVIEDRHYLCDPELVQLTPGAGPALAALARAGCRLFLVTNQSGLGRGYFNHAQYQAVQDRLDHMLRPFGAAFAATAMCPHSPDHGCSCRKPLPGLWEELRHGHGLFPQQSMMIGDKAADILFAKACGLAASILVLTGQGRKAAQDMGLPPLRQGWLELHEKKPHQPDVVAKDLTAAARWILSVAT
ncbi:MAG TPA: HAD-IIIA family hydrolase [Desulfonatronum sp.]|nr:HAD-IIIA family hydrolase [Desulfonatronum sp.]